MRKAQQNPAIQHMKNLLKGLTVAWFAATIVHMLGAGLVSGGYIPEKSTDYISVISLIFSAMTGAWIVKKRTETYTWLWCMIFGLVYFISLLCVGILLFEGQHSGVLVTLLITEGGSTAAALVNIGKKNRIHVRRKPYALRGFV